MNKPKKLPYFKLYVQDFLASLDVQMMTREDVGSYFLLLLNSWAQKDSCFLPDDDEILRKICRVEKEEWGEAKKTILKKFKSKDGKIFNEKLLAVKNEDEEYSDKKRQAGKMGSDARWANEKKAVENSINSIKNKELIPIFRDFLQNRLDSKKANTAKSVEISVEKINAMSAEDARISIKASIENGWAGIFPKKEKKKSGEIDPFEGHKPGRVH